MMQIKIKDDSDSTFVEVIGVLGSYAEVESFVEKLFGCASALWPSEAEAHEARLAEAAAPPPKKKRQYRVDGPIGPFAEKILKMAKAGMARDDIAAQLQRHPRVIGMRLGSLKKRGLL